MLPGRKGRPIAGTSLGQTGQVSRAKSQHWGQRTPGLCTKTQLAIGRPRPPRLSDSPSVPQPGAGGAHSAVLAAGQPSAVSHVTKAEPPVPQVEPALVLAPGAASRTPRSPAVALCCSPPARTSPGRQRCHLPALPHANQQVSLGPSSKGPTALRAPPCLQSPLPELRGRPQHTPLPRPRHNACL